MQAAHEQDTEYREKHAWYDFKQQRVDPEVDCEQRVVIDRVDLVVGGVIAAAQVGVDDVLWHVGGYHQDDWRDVDSAHRDGRFISAAPHGPAGRL